MKERLAWQKQTKREKGASLESLRSAGAERPAGTPEPIEDPRAGELAEIARERWEQDAKERRDKLSATEYASVGEALRDFVVLMAQKPALEAAAEASAALGDDERLSFYDDLAREELIPLETVLSNRKNVSDESIDTEAEKPLSAYEHKFAELKEDLGEPYGIAYGSVVWKRGDGSAEILEKDGTRWNVPAGRSHTFGAHGRVLMRYWTERGFMTKEDAAQWLLEKKRLDPTEEKATSPLSHGPVGDIRALVDEKLKNEAPYTMSAVSRLRPSKEQKRKERSESRPARAGDVGPEEDRMGRSVKEVSAKLGEPLSADGIAYWKRADGAAVVFDSPGSGVPKMPLLVRRDGTHRFPSGRKRWTGTEFVDAQ